MSNTPQRLIERFVAFNDVGYVQVNADTPFAASLLNKRHKCEIAREEIVLRQEIRDCRNQDIQSEKVRTRGARYTFTYSDLEPKIKAFWGAYFLGAAAAPTGTPFDEVQRLSRSGTVSGGTFTLALTLEGRTVTTKAIDWNATVTQIRNAMTAGNMKFIQPGDVEIAMGTSQVETLTVLGTANASANLPVTIIAAGKSQLSGAGKTVQVAIINGDTASVVAGKIRAALAADTDVGDFFVVSGATDQAVFTAKLQAANDATMAISYPTASGMTGATSANTTAGVFSESDWTNGVTIAFRRRMGRANLALLVVSNSVTGGGSVINTGITDGAQRYHSFTRSTSNVKARFSFMLGWENVTNRFERYAGYAVESINLTGTRRQPTGLVVSVVGPWEPDIITSGYVAPACENPDILMTDDVRVLVNANWETTDVNTVAYTLNDNVPTDEISAYGFDDVDIQVLERGDQPSYSIASSIFGSEVDAIYALAQNERTQDPVDWKTHFGQPGNRFSVIIPKTKVKFQTSRMGVAGTLNKSVINLDGTAHDDGLNPPFRAEAYIDQAVAFLQTAP